VRPSTADILECSTPIHRPLDHIAHEQVSDGTPIKLCNVYILTKRYAGLQPDWLFQDCVRLLYPSDFYVWPFKSEYACGCQPTG